MQSVRGAHQRSETVLRAAEKLTAGEPILVYDAPDREGETDLMFLSEQATPELVRLLRRDGGGLICAAISQELRGRLGLPYAEELLTEGAPRYPALAALGRYRPRYDHRSAFGITVNHRGNFTGVTDNDRAQTLRALGTIAGSAARLGDRDLAERFREEFCSPGHIPLLYAAPRLLTERKGHTELSISLARMAGLAESVTVCEMLGDSGGPRGPEAAERYAEAHGYLFLEGRSIIEAWDRWSA
ncbi:MAG: 3,4-dihydroxy-2-butanone-4-phosphate synthase [Thermoplasmata archaeon]